MTKKQLRQYPALCREIERIDERLLKESHSGVVSDVVSGSDSEYPYTRRKFTVTGMDDGKRAYLLRRKEKCVRERDLILSFIEDIEESYLRQIFELRNLEGLTFRAVALRLGGVETEDGVRMKHDRYLRKNK